MITAQKLARYGATFALALTMVASAAPTLAFADDGNNDAYDPSSAPFVLSTVSGGVQAAAGATEFGLGTGAAASGVEGLGIANGGTELGAAAAGLGLEIPQGIVGAP